MENGRTYTLYTPDFQPPSTGWSWPPAAANLRVRALKPTPQNLALNLGGRSDPQNIGPEQLEVLDALEASPSRPGGPEGEALETLRPCGGPVPVDARSFWKWELRA